MFAKLSKHAVIMSAEHLEKDEALSRLISIACSTYSIYEPSEIISLVVARETKLSTGIGLEIAVPHCKSTQVDSVVVAVMLIPSGIQYNSVDGKPVKIIFLIISPLNDIQGHLACLSAISHAVSDETTRLKFLKSSSPDKLYTNLLEIDHLIPLE